MNANDRTEQLLEQAHNWKHTGRISEDSPVIAVDEAEEYFNREFGKVRDE